MSERQGRVEQLMMGNGSELIELRNHPSSSGWQGSNPEEYFATSEISGHNAFHSWRDEDKEYHYLPGFGFKFTIGRRIISPFDRFDGGHIFMSSSGMTSGVDNAKTKLWLHLPDNSRFFDILNAIRNGDKFSPFQVRGAKELLDNLKTPHFLTIAAYVERNEVHARVENLQVTDVESVIESFIKIYVEETEKFRTLEPHYQETDDEGTRLWTDQGLQSKTYYDLRKKLARKLLGKIAKVLNRHSIKYQTSWDLTTSLAMMRHGASEYGWPMVLMSLAGDVQYKVRNLFKSHEELRQERLASQKARDKEREESKQKRQVKIIDCNRKQ